MQGKAAVLGDPDFVMPFSALGLDTYAVSQKTEELTDAAETIVRQRYALVVVAENIAPAVEDVFAPEQDKPTPCVVVVPFTKESQGYAVKTLGRILKIATGIDIIQSNSN